MDLIKQLGPLALGSRMRRLTDRFAQDVSTIYREHDIDFEPRWFPVYYLLSRQSPQSIVDISRLLGISHPCVNQIAGDMIKHGIVKALKDKTDKRKRLLALTDKGEAMLAHLQPLWNDVEAASLDLISAAGYDVLAVMEKLEEALDEKTLYARFRERHKQRLQNSVEILDYSPELKPYFKSLNEEWITRLFKIEPEDERVLSNPEKEILQHGGQILFARCKNSDRDEIVGTCALVNLGNETYELAKMAVTEKARGRQIGKKLLAASIDKARSLNAKTMVLETNSSLTPAINLYRKLGFVLVPFDEKNHSHYERADVRMQLDLSK